MKLKLSVLIFILLLLSPFAEAASNTIKSYIFDGSLYINYEKVNFEKDMLSVNGSVYVPLRNLTEFLNGRISYEAKDRTIHLTTFNKNQRKSSVNSSDKDNLLTLHIFSEKEEYKFGEPIEIWTRLSNHSEKTLEISHGSPLINYWISDDNGFVSSSVNDMVEYSSVFRPGDEYVSDLDEGVFYIYNIEKNNVTDFESYLKNTDHPLTLPKGEYIIHVKSEYSIKENSKNNIVKLETSIAIKIT